MNNIKVGLKELGQFCLFCVCAIILACYVLFIPLWLFIQEPGFIIIISCVIWFAWLVCMVLGGVWVIGELANTNFGGWNF